MYWSVEGDEKLYGYFACSNCEVNIGKAVEQEETLCDEVEAVREFTYVGDRVSAGGVCEASMSARLDMGWLSLRNVVSCCMERGFLYS